MLISKSGKQEDYNMLFQICLLGKGSKVKRLLKDGRVKLSNRRYIRMETAQHTAKSLKQLELDMLRQVKNMFKYYRDFVGE